MNAKRAWTSIFDNFYTINLSSRFPWVLSIFNDKTKSTESYEELKKAYKEIQGHTVCKGMGSHSMLKNALK